MTDRLIFVYVDLNTRPQLVGRIWSHYRGGSESASFEYDASWLSHPDRFMLEPGLPLKNGSFHTEADKALFGSFGDSTPDRWGRNLIRRTEQLRSRVENSPIRTYTELDYLVSVNDECRQGALRYSEKEGDPFLSVKFTPQAAPISELPKLLTASDNFFNEKETEQELGLLLEYGSTLGGARPKLSLLDGNGDLSIAKLPRPDDDDPIVLWEAVALTLAGQSGIQIPEWKVHNVSGKPVLILKRFDRIDGTRVPFISAMTMLNAKDNEDHSYLEIADAIQNYGAFVKADLNELWRRIVFNILISNTDDHLRNHAFLLSSRKGWCLSPAYDMNPVPIDIKKRFLSTAIDHDSKAASLEIALSVVDEFFLTMKDAETIINEVKGAVSQWRHVASKVGLRKKEIDRMSSAFE